jgi:hypothetical protein
VTVSGRGVDEFSITSQTCANVVLYRGDSCRVRVRFAPEDEGPRLALLTIAATPGGSLVVPLEGEGVVRK